MIGNDWHKKGLKKNGIDIIENQIFESWMHGLWAGFLNLIHSHTYARLKPNAHRHRSCAGNKEQTCNFGQNIENCFDT